ncbi:thioredoxin domain-containing protein [Brevundimonas sp.]|uniref:thioredoxin domain-containing protein n=1 Tax=Brevundimonas sp. TaxID=1871086 RepID=UPI002D3F029B|nr:thioredoxin domain-containing protein [Brevundimonas sp.]HYC75637.1 thioredoxin domain-containing protein [Brevundimonas sp.]
MKRLSRFLLTLLIAIAAPAAALAQTVEPVRPGDRTLGAPDAPVTLTVYLSTTCSHCADWHTNDFPAFKARWVDTGKVRVAFRDLPTPPQQVAIAGAVMARCAPEEKYDAVLDALFRGQSQLRGQPGPPPQQTVVAWLAAGGAAGGLNRDQMNACFSSEASFTEVEARAEQSFADGVNSTPSFFINGQPVPETMAARDVAAFEPLVQPLLDGR